MNLNIRELPAMLDRNGVNLQDRRYALALALARYCAYACALPSSAIDGCVRDWFGLHCADAVQTDLSQINEMVPLDVDLAYQLTMRLWQARYEAVHCPTSQGAIAMFDHVISIDRTNLPPQANELMIRYPVGLFRSVQNLLDASGLSCAVKAAPVASEEPA